MIWAAITAVLGWVGDLPRWVKIAAIGLIAALALLMLHKCAVDRAVEADRTEQAAKVQETARQADSAAHGAVEAKRNEVDNANDEARRAADGSDDKLRAAFDSLRDGQTGNRTPAD